MALVFGCSMVLAGEADAGHAGEHPARTSQPDTPPDDERGTIQLGRAFVAMDRFPHAFVNSCSPLHRRRRWLQAFKLGGRTVLQGRVQTLLVVDVLQEGADAGAGIFQVLVLAAIDFLTL